MIEIICYVMICSMLGLMFSALISANKYSSYNQRMHELAHEIKTLTQRGRKPRPKKKPVRSRNA